MILKVNETETITVTVSPSNATDKRVTFSSSDNNIATIDENGKVTALAGGKATITVTSVADNSKKATVNVVVGDILIPATFADDPTLGTIQNEIDKADEESTIVVMPAAYPKTYNEQLVINKSLTLLGLNTALNGTITITADNVTVDGFNVVAPSDYTLPVIHIIDSDGVNIINNTVFSQGYASIGTSSGPARVTGKISGNKVTGMIIVGTDGELEVSDNDVTLTPTSTEGICFYPVETTARINVINNKIGQVRDGFTQIKVEHEPESVNGKTRDIDIIEAITEDNYGATVQLSWTTIYYVSTTGNDNNPGTQEAPFANIQKAVNAANDGDIIIVQEGSYNVWCPTTDPNNYTGRDHNLFIGKNITIKGEGIVDIYSYQTAYKSTFDARIIVLISGSNGVVIDNLNIYPAYYPGDISTGLPSVTNSKINSITGQSNLKVYYNQIVDTLMVYNGSGTTSESTITDVTVRDCTIGDPDLAAEKWGSAIYFNGYNNNQPLGIKGGYTVEGNTFYGSLTLCEDASWDAASQDCIIQNNHFYGNLHLVGARPTGWNHESMTVFPTVKGNTFYKANASITDTDGSIYDYFVGSRDISQEKLITRAQLETIIEDNFFRGDLDGKEIDIAIGAHTYSTPGDEYHAIIYVKKVTPVVDTAVEATMVTVGQTLADSELSGTFKVSAEDGTEVAGTLAWDTTATVVNDAGEFGWTFTPVDRLTYNKVKGVVSVTASNVVNATQSIGYDTIQAAIGAASVGDTIEVAAGTYTESIIINKANLTLQSKDGAAKTIIDGDGERNAVKITADDVTVDGFTITGANYQYEGAVFLDRVEDCIIKNNLITSNYRAGIFMRQADNNTIENNTIRENTIGIHMVHGDYATSTSCNYNTIEGNTIENNAAYGISLSSSYSQANAATGNTIKNNIIKNNNTDTPSYQKKGKGITITGVWVSNTIEDNTISGHNYNGISSGNSAQNNVIKNNVIDNNSKAYTGAGVENGAGIYFASASEAKSDNSRASFGNTIEGNNITNHWNGIDLRGLTGNDAVVMYNNTIKGNTISSNTVNGIYLYDGVSNNTIEENKIVNNATHASREGYGVHATQRTEGNAATHNWWGSANGPGQDGANGVSDNVTYEPWYTDEAMDTLVSETALQAAEAKLAALEAAIAAIKPSWAVDKVEPVDGDEALPDDGDNVDYKVTIKTSYTDKSAAQGSGRTVTTLFTIPEGVTVWYPVWEDSALTYKSASSGEVALGMVGHPLSAGNIDDDGIVYVSLNETITTEFNFTIKLIDADEDWQGVVYGEEELEIKVSDYGFETVNVTEIIAGGLLDGHMYESPDGQSLGDLDVSHLTAVKVTLKATAVKDLGYKKVRILPLEVSGPNGSILQAWMYASENDEKWWDVAETGWGSAGTGFKLDADEDTEMDAYVFVDTPGTYTVTFKAVDTSDPENEIVIAQGEVTILAPFHFDAETETITEYIGSEENVTIPATVNGVTVKAIGKEAFKGNNTIKTVTFEDDSLLETIEAEAFNECFNLKSISIPDSVTSIWSVAFRCCYALTSIDIPENVTSIKEFTFFGSALQSITIPGVKDIESFALADIALQSITIPDGCTLGYQALSSNSNLTTIIMGSGITVHKDALFVSEVNSDRGFKAAYDNETTGGAGTYILNESNVWVKQTP